MKTTRILSAIVIAAIALAGCGGGGGSGTLPHPPVTSPQKKPSALHIRIKVPGRKKTQHRKRPAYVSPSTQSIAVAVDGGTATPFNIGPAVGGCTGNAPYGYACTFSMSVPSGMHSFAVTSYDGSNAGGSILSSNTVSMDIAPSQVNNLNITLNGVIASLALVLANSTPRPGTAANIPLSVNAYDADNNLIIAPGTYQNGPITVMDSDASGATSLSVVENGQTQSSGTQVTVQDPSATVTVVYTGRFIANATFSASAGSIQTSGTQDAVLTSYTGPIQHIVIIVQENRTPDNLFHGLPGTDGPPSTVTLTGTPLVVQYNLNHNHSGFLNDMTGHWNPEQLTYVEQSYVQPYYTLAENYTFADRMFQTNEGPSYPAHQYLISGTSSIADGSTILAAENMGGTTAPGYKGGCDSVSGTTVLTIDTTDPTGTEGNPVFPCFNRLSLMDELNSAGISWKYYEATKTAGIWNAPDSVRSIRYGPSYANVIAPPTQVLTDITNGNLAAVTWVTPAKSYSDHPTSDTTGGGPSWVASIVNEIGQSQYWNNTAIFVVWDDWGGFYDHVQPTPRNSYELGFRVPLIVISPYAKAGYVSNTQYEFGSILQFVEQTFSLPSMGTTDATANSLNDCFDFSGSPNPYKVVPAKLNANYFKHDMDERLPDND